MMRFSIVLITLLVCSVASNAQVAINADHSQPDASAILDVKSTTKGFLLPRLTTSQRNNISNPAEGLTIYNTDENCLEFWNGSAWYNISTGIATVYNSCTGETWMDRNLGASQIATSSTDSYAYGDLYQWGRAADGHEIRTSGITADNATTAVPNDGNSWDGLFITEASSPYDWLVPPDNTLWQSISGTNNPCPDGFRIPTEIELEAERLCWATNNASGAYGSVIKWTVGGYRARSNGTLFTVGTWGFYWGSTANGVNARSLYFNSSDATMYTTGRADGFSVRCIMD